MLRSGGTSSALDPLEMGTQQEEAAKGSPSGEDDLRDVSIRAVSPGDTIVAAFRACYIRRKVKRDRS